MVVRFTGSEGDVGAAMNYVTNTILRVGLVLK